MEFLDPLNGLEPLQGQLVALKTVQETRAVENTAKAYVAEIDIKSASKVLKIVDSSVPRDPALSLGHVRRFAKPEFLPEPLRNSESEAKYGDTVSPRIFILIPPPLPETSVLETLLGPYAPKRTSSEEQEREPEPIPIRILTTEISLQPPNTLAQAQEWSRKFWPTTYNPAAYPATHSPPPTILARAKATIEPRVGSYLALARRIASEAKRTKRGRAIGAVVVDPALADAEPTNPFAGIVAAAGDARYWKREDNNGANGSSTSSQTEQQPPGSNTYNPDIEGQPDHHALMRVISLIAEKRRDVPTSPIISPSMTPTPSGSQAPTPTQTPTLTPSHKSSSSSSPPQTPLESHFLKSSKLLTRTQGGYLCTALDVYITHEPCICCSMGMLLSRFRSIIFAKGTGRVDSALEPEKGYGLHWRQELNWRVFGFQFLEEKKVGEGKLEGEDATRSNGEELEERGVFHA